MGGSCLGGGTRRRSEGCVLGGVGREGGGWRVEEVEGEGGGEGAGVTGEVLGGRRHHPVDGFFSANKAACEGRFEIGRGVGVGNCEEGREMEGVGKERKRGKCEEAKYSSASAGKKRR